jgi:hypothetical protein
MLEKSSPSVNDKIDRADMFLVVADMSDNAIGGEGSEAKRGHGYHHGASAICIQ